MTPFARSLLAMPLAAVIAACAEVPTLEPAAGANTSAIQKDTAVATVAGVAVTAGAEEWPGPQAEIVTEVTPLHVSIENDSANPISVTYGNLALVAADGTRYTALPLYEIDGEVSRIVRVEKYPPVSDLAFYGTGFSLAPHYGSVYPQYPVYDGPFFYDWGYYRAYGTYYRDIQLPTETMQRLALPEGVLEHGGRVSGWVYFQKVDAEKRKVVLRYDVERARTGEEFAEMRIPFTVKE